MPGLNPRWTVIHAKGSDWLRTRIDHAGDTVLRTFPCPWQVAVLPERGVAVLAPAACATDAVYVQRKFPLAPSKFDPRRCLLTALQDLQDKYPVPKSNTSVPSLDEAHP